MLKIKKGLSELIYGKPFSFLNMVFLDENSPFPEVELADGDGLLAIGGTLSIERLLTAYRSGIFPWFSEGEPILWWSPDPRFVLFPEKFKISKSLRQTLRKNKFTITFNSAFDKVIEECSRIERKGQDGTWITAEMQKAYNLLHKMGHAISVEVWLKEKLVGGLYGIDLPDKKVFCGESMFSKENDASKIAFHCLIQHLSKEKYKLVDCQVYTSHLSSLGAEEIERRFFLDYLK